MADDDEDDRYFFKKALIKLSLSATLVTVADGAELMSYLSKNRSKLPDILFLDINMPRKNGYECLVEIKANTDTKKFPVIMYSTSLDDAMADLLYQEGAQYYLCKGNLPDLEKYLQTVLTLLDGNNLQRPSRKEFLLNPMRVV